MAKKIDRFNQIRELGKGSQGVVHLAVDTKKMLLKEARTVSKMVHPNIVSIYEAGEEEQ